METTLVIFSAGLIIFLAHLFSVLFEKTRVPDVLLLLLIGLLIGPVTGTVDQDVLGEVGNVFAIIALVIIVFECGLGLTLSSIRESMGQGVRLSVVNFVGTLLVVLLICRVIFNMSVLEALILGSILGSASPAVAIPLVERLRLQPGTRTALILESTFGEVIAIVFALGFIQAVEHEELRPTLMFGSVIASFLLAGVLGVLAAFFWSSVLNRVRQLKNNAFLTPAFVFVVYGVTELLGYSGVISALVFGIVLGNMESLQKWQLMHHPTLSENAFFRSLKLAFEPNEREKAFFAEIVFLVRTFFFVYIGLSIPLEDSTSLLAGLVITIALFLVRIRVVHASLDKGATTFDASIAAVMVPKGLAAAVVASVAVEAEIGKADVIQGITYATILFTIVATSVLTFLVEKTRVRRFYASLFSKYAPEEPVSRGALYGRQDASAT
jgi:cell volume regulation protein A